MGILSPLNKNKLSFTEAVAIQFFLSSAIDLGIFLTAFLGVERSSKPSPKNRQFPALTVNKIACSS